jgi:hypothetical protein
LHGSSDQASRTAQGGDTVSNGTLWSPTELMQLEAMAGNMPADLAIQSYKRWAASNGYPARSTLAIQGACYRYGMKMEATGRWLTLGGIAAALAISIDGPEHWVDKGLLVSRHKSAGHRPHRYVRRDDLLTFAREHPDRLGGIPAERLALLLEDEELAQAIATAHPHRPWHRKAVRCVETGKVYATVRAAAAAAWVRRQAITYALRTGGTAGGFHWQEVGA